MFKKSFTWLNLSLLLIILCLAASCASTPKANSSGVDYRKEASRALERLRKDPADSPRWFTSRIRESAEKGGFSLAEIKTSEQELDQLFKEGYRRSAARYLYFLRKYSQEGAENLYHELDLLESQLKAGKISLEEIGSSRQEISKLIESGYINKAKKLLAIHRQGKNGEFFDLSDQIEFLSKFKEFPLSKIGTSPEELAKLKKAEYKRAAQKALSGFRKNREKRNEYLDCLIRLASKGGFTLAEIGFTADELNSLPVFSFK